MKELKTLKDIDPEDGAVWKHEIRSEAIKWMKDLPEAMNYTKSKFMEFFNITEYDLK